MFRKKVATEEILVEFWSRPNCPTIVSFCSHPHAKNAKFREKMYFWQFWGFIGIRQVDVVLGGVSPRSPAVRQSGAYAGKIAPAGRLQKVGTVFQTVSATTQNARMRVSKKLTMCGPGCSFWVGFLFYFSVLFPVYLFLLCAFRISRQPNRHFGQIVILDIW
jgi:hypothetical protein